ncbi:Nicalin-1 [Bienertia sinuspersici]
MAVCMVILASVELGDAATAVDVYRLIQYDLAGIPFGSRFANLNHHASSSLNADLSRTVLIIPIRDLSLSSLQDYIDRKTPLGGLLFLLPGDFDHQRDDLVRLERLLIHAYIPYPVYFAFENQHIRDVFAHVKHNDATGQPATATTGGYKLVVSTTEAKKVSFPTITNIQVI